MRFNPRQLGFVLILLGLGGLVLSRLPRESTGPDEAASASTARESCRVLTVYDGDTLGCDLNRDGRIERPEEEIRLLGIDSPEMHYSKKNPTHDSAHPVDEPYAKGASAWLTHAAQGKTIYLEFDQRRSDKYGRTLAYVYEGAAQKTSLNEQALRGGYAKVLILGRNRRYEDAFMQAESQAREGGRGLWRGADCAEEPICKSR